MSEKDKTCQTCEHNSPYLILAPCLLGPKRCYEYDLWEKRRDEP